MQPPFLRPQLDDSRDHAPPPFHGFGWLAGLALAVALLTLWMLLYPFDFQSQRITGFFAERSLGQVHKINLLLNVLLFVPFGLLAGWIWKIVLPGRTWLIILLVAFDAAIMSGIAEFLQMWLPEPVRSVIDPGDHTMPPITAAARGRTSSLFDFLANTAGAAAGAMLALALLPRLNHHWHALGRWLAAHPRGRRAFAIFIIVLLARAAPFDATIETSYLRAKFTYISKPTGGPFSATRQWLAGDIQTRADKAASGRAALLEGGRAVLNAVLFAALAGALARAFEESRSQRSRARAPHGFAAAFALAVALVILTELLQHPIRSRLMDATDPVAGAIGALAGVAIAFMTPHPRPDPPPGNAGPS